jgi:hypothetical protein
MSRSHVISEKKPLIKPKQNKPCSNLVLATKQQNKTNKQRSNQHPSQVSVRSIQLPNRSSKIAKSMLKISRRVKASKKMCCRSGYVVEVDVCRTGYVVEEHVSKMYVDKTFQTAIVSSTRQPTSSGRKHKQHDRSRTSSYHAEMWMQPSSRQTERPATKCFYPPYLSLNTMSV